MRRSSKINKKRRQSSSSLSADFFLICALIVIGVLVYYLNKNGETIQPTSGEIRASRLGSRTSSNNLVEKNEENTNEEEEEEGGGNENGAGLHNEQEAGNIFNGDSVDVIENDPEI